MFRWLLIIMFLCPCPCQWDNTGKVREKAAFHSSCCGSCDSDQHASHEHSDEPQKECPRCASTANIPPSRVSWNPMADSGIGGIVPALKVTGIEELLSPGSAGQIFLNEWIHASPSVGSGLNLRV